MIKGAVLLVAALALGELFREPSITNLCQVPFEYHEQKVGNHSLDVCTSYLTANSH